MKKAKSSSISKHMIHVPEFKYIPPEIWTRILPNIPAKNLLTFRCVCKSWCSIIDDPDFISMHLKHCSINSSNRKFLLALEGLGCDPELGGYSLSVRQADTLEKTACIFENRDLHKYRILGSCNGLLLVRQCRAPLYLDELRVSNPCIRKSLRLPKCPLPLSSLTDYAIYVFGYAPVSQDYKVIAIAPDLNPRNMYVAVYSLKNQQWSVRNNGLSFDSSEFNRMFYEISKNKLSTISVFFQGAVYWIGNSPTEDIHNGNEPTPTHLVSFDFDSEKLAYLKLPKPVLQTQSLRFVFLLRESLAILSISNVSISIWLLENRAWTWRFTGDSSRDEYDVFLNCKLAKNKIFYCESDDGGCFLCGKKSYNIASRQVKEVGKSMSKYVYLETYVDSLVCCKEYGKWLNYLAGGGVWRSPSLNK